MKLAPKVKGSILLILLGAFFSQVAYADSLSFDVRKKLPLTTKGDLATYSTTITALAVGADGTILSSDSSTSTGLRWVTPSAGGAGTPSGATTNVQYNDAGAFGGDPSFSWDKTKNSLGISVDAAQTGIAFAISNDVGAVLANISHDGAASFKRTVIMDRLSVITQDTANTADVFVDSEGSAVVYIDRGGTSAGRVATLQFQTAGTKQFSIGPVSATDQIVIQDEGSNTMMTIADGGTTGNVTITGTLAVNGGLPSSDVTGTVGINRGGTGFTSYTKGDLLLGVTNSSALGKLPIGSMGQVLSVDTGSTTGVAWVTSPTGGGTPGTPLNSFQWNSASTFAGASTMTWDSANGPRVTIGDTRTGTNAPSLDVAGSFRTTPVTLTDAVNISVDASRSNFFTVILGGTRRVMNPTLGGSLMNDAYRGQKITFLISQDATGSRKVSWDTRYQFGTDVPSYDASTTARVHDLVSFVYSSPSWDCVGTSKGYF